MELRAFGRTGMELSALGFGCGAVGGLMVRGEPANQDRAIARAIEAGVNYFDTAAAYGQGESEKNLGRVLRALKPRQVFVGSKVSLDPAEAVPTGEAITKSLEGSLARLGREQVDVLYLHNAITLDGQAPSGGGRPLTPRRVIDEVAPAFERLRREGKARFLGVTAVGDTGALREVIDSGAFDAAQVAYNMLNPSAGEDLPKSYPAQDYERLFDRTAAAGVGVASIRVLAGGALSGSTARHPVASPPPAQIGSTADYVTEVDRARRFLLLVDEGYVANLAEAAIRFSLSHPAVGVAVVGLASVDELEAAIGAVEKGPLTKAALQRVAALRGSLA